MAALVFFDSCSYADKGVRATRGAAALGCTGAVGKHQVPPAGFGMTGEGIWTRNKRGEIRYEEKAARQRPSFFAEQASLWAKPYFSQRTRNGTPRLILYGQMPRVVMALATR